MRGVKYLKPSENPETKKYDLKLNINWMGLTVSVTTGEKISELGNKSM